MTLAIRFANQQAPQPKRLPPSRTVQVIGHRGDFYEKGPNTLESILSAFTAGADAVEIDVHLSKDGIPVVHHEARLGQSGFVYPDTRKNHRIKDLSYAQIQNTTYCKQNTEETLSRQAQRPVALNLDSIPQFPSLEMVLDHLPADKKLFIELKQPVLSSLYQNALEKAVVRLIQKKNLEQQVVLISFNPLSVLKVKRLAPTIQTGWDVSPRLDSDKWIPLAKHLFKIDYWLPALAQTTLPLIQKCQQYGLPVIPWIDGLSWSQEQARLEQLYPLGISGFITNQPSFLRQMVDQSH